MIVALAAMLVALRPQRPPHPHVAHMLVGIYDEGQTLYGDHGYAFPMLQSLHTQILRTNLYWGGTYGAAKTRPAVGADPEDPPTTGRSTTRSSVTRRSTG